VSSDHRSEREARRELLRDSLRDLAAGRSDPDRAADDVLRAIDSYIDHHTVAPAQPREPPVIDHEAREAREVRWATWVVVGGAAVASVLVAALVGSGGLPTALAVLAVWIGAIIALTQT
jgi:hypothetical protein